MGLRDSPLPIPPHKGEGIHLSVFKKRAEFLATAAHGKKWVTPSFIVQIAPAAANGIHYGLTASSKVGNAVKRNRCRRRMRALVTEIFPPLASADFQYVLIARDKAATNDFDAMKKDLLWALKKLGALRGA